MSFAQFSENPINWQVSIKMLSDTEGVATFKAIIEPGWHLYGMSMPEDGPKATTIDLATSKGLEFEGEPSPARTPLEVHDSMFDLDLNWWDSDIAIRQKFKVVDPDSDVLSGTISYMGCNNMTCSPPQTFTFTKTIPAK